MEVAKLSSDVRTEEIARLLEENHHLRQMVEERNAELAIIQSVQEGLASRLDVQSIYDLVGDKIREIFDAQGTAVYIFNLETETLDTPYCFLKKRFEIESRPFSDHPIASLMVDRIQPIIYRTVEEYRVLGGTVLENSEEYKSGMYVPLMVGKELKGMLGVANLDRENAYGESDLRLLITLANSMSVALENARLFAETEQDAAELQIINSVQEGLATKLDIQAIYELVGDKIREIFHNADTEIRIHDPKTNLIRVPYFTDMGKRIAVDPIPLTDVGISSYVLRTGKTLVINENLMQEMEKYGAKMLPGGHPAKSAVFVPLMVNQQARGLIVLGNVEREHAFRESDVRLLQTLAGSMSTALENARLFDEIQSLLNETQQRNAELAIINSVQKGLTEGVASRRDIQAIYDLVGDKIRELFPHTDTEIRVYDPKTNLIYFPYFIDDGKRVTVDPILLTDSGFSSYVLRTGQTLVINENFVQEVERFGTSTVLLEGGHLAKSAVFVPLMVNNQARGLLVLGNVEREHAFGSSDIRLFETLANSLSPALENARLFDETQSLLRETEQRNAELAIINSVQAGLAEGLASKRDIQAIYNLVGDKIRELFPNTDTEIRIYDPKTNLFQVPYYLENGQRASVDPISLSDATMSAHVLRTGQTLVVNENIFQEMEKYGATMMRGRRVPAKSVVFVPLMVGTQARGLIILNNVEREHAFSESDVRLLQTLASSMSTALENARLFDETQRLLKETQQRNAELAIINSVQEALASKLDMQAIYDLVGDKIREIFDAQGTGVYIFNHETGIAHTPYCFLKKRLLIEPSPFPPVAQLMIDTKQPTLYRTYSEYCAIGGKVLENQDQCQSGMFVPLMVGKHIKGMVGVANVDKENAYGESDLRLLTTLANSMSTAIENVRLFDEVQKKNVEITGALERETASNDILRVIAESPTDIQPVLEVIARNAAQLSGSDDAIITLRDGDILHVDAHYGDIPTFSAGEGMHFNRDSVAGRAILEGRPRQAIHNQSGVQSEYPEGDKVAEKYGYRMTCAVPLMREGKAIGAISIRRIKPELLTEKQIALIQSFANQAAIAVENVRLFNETTRLLKESEQRAAELAIINSVQEGLVSKLDVQAIYELVGDKIRDVFDAQTVSLVTYDRTTNLMHPMYLYESGKQVDVAGKSYEVFGFRQHVIQKRKSLVINQDRDQLAEKFNNPIHHGAPAKSAIFVPMITGAEVIGVISLQNMDRENAFSESDVRLLETLSNSMSVALENARLFDETQRLLKETEQRNAELAIINSVQEGLASKLDMQAIYDLVGDKIRDLFNPHHLWILTFDPIARTRRVRYSLEKGQRYYPEEVFPYNKLTEYLIATKKPLVINQNFKEAIADFDMANIIGTLEDAKSVVYVPMLAGEEVKGFISLQNVERENAFSESDINLLSTFASSMSITLENILLFDETQRLLKETEQRAAELAIVNSVQEGLASKLDMQAIYELVGDKMQEIFDAQSLLIVTFDQVNELAHITYNREKGVRYYSEPYPFTGLHRYLIQSRNTVVINENSLEWQAKFGMVLLPGTEQPKSMVFVPLTSGYRVSGVISLQNLEREHAFSEMDVRLLETLASSMSVALENASLFDETQRLFLEAKDARTAAEQADQAKSAFLSSMSHELRTPLNAIINFVEMVARGMIGPVNQEQVELLDQALHSSKHLLNLINDVLDISKIQAGQLTLFIEDQVSVQIEVDAALSMVGGLLQEKHLQLIRDIDPHLPMISCDRRRLRQILLNLISNAIKFTDKGTVTVSVKNQGQEVLFAVIDTGAGIPPDKQDLIFEPFIQTENGERQMQGTGLGLPISRSLVRAHGGELWVDSDQGEGSAFFFTMPVERKSTA